MKQLEDSVVKKIRFSGKKELIDFALNQLQLTDMVSPFLDY